MNTLFSLIGSLAAMVGIGAAISGKINFGSEVKQAFVMIIINIAMPCMVLQSLFSLPVDAVLLREIGLVLLLSAAVHSLGMAMGWFGSFTLNVSGQKRKELAVLAGLGNTGFIGIPVCSVLFGAKGALLAAVFDSGLDLVIWTYVMFILQERTGSRWTWGNLRAAVNAPMAAIAAGLLLSFLQLEPPLVVKQLIGMLGSVTVPLAMLYVGLLLAQLVYRKTNVSSRLLPVPVAVKLVILPLTVACLTVWLPLSRDVLQVVLMQSAMPTITIASILFAKCGADEELAVVTTVISTVVSAATIPIAVAWFTG